LPSDPQTVDWGLFSGVTIGLLGIITGIATALWANRQNRRLAEETGAFSRPDIRFRMFGLDVDEVPTARHWCIAHPSGDREPLIAPVRLELANAGDADAEDVVLSIQAFGGLILSGRKEDGAVAIFTPPAQFEDGFKREVRDIGGLRQLIYCFKRITPGVSVIIPEPLVLTPTRIPHVVDAKTADGVPIRISVVADFAYALVVTIMASNRRPSSRIVAVECIRGATVDELEKNYFEIAEREDRRRMSSLPRIQRLMRSIRGPRVRKSIWLAYIPSKATAHVGGRTIHGTHANESQPEVRMAVRQLYS
jgi:hypothetical protein